jgi:hypothetical protein
MRSIRLKSPSGHTKACVPCALTVVLNQPYEKVNNWLKLRKVRRSDRSGTFTDRINMKELGLEEVYLGKGKTVNQFVMANPTGTFLLLVSRHGLALHNGIAHDTGDSMRRFVKNIYKVVEEHKLPADFEQEEKKMELAPSMKRRGEAGKTLRTLIACGNTDIQDLMKQSGASYIYCRYILIETGNWTFKQPTT